MSDLMRPGLAITVLGMGLVFVGLALLWALVALLGKLFPEKAADETTALRTPPAEATVPGEGHLAVIVPLARSPASPAEAHSPTVAPPAGEPPPSPEEALTAERARVAAVVAGAMLSNALPMLFEVPAGPAFEHGRTAPLWVAANRARALPAWQPARRPDIHRNPESLA